MTSFFAWLFLFASVVAVMFVRSTAGDRTSLNIRSKTITIAAAFVAATVVCFYLAAHERAKVNEFAEIIVLYPNVIEELTLQYSTGTELGVILTTRDSEEAVKRFYMNPANLRGWVPIDSTVATVRYARNAERLRIGVVRSVSSDGKSDITYEWTNK